MLGRFLGDEGGATMVEYALMLAFIAIVCIAAVTAVGGSTLTLFNDIRGSMPSV